MNAILGLGITIILSLILLIADLGVISCLIATVAVATEVLKEPPSASATPLLGPCHGPAWDPGHFISVTKCHRLVVGMERHALHHSTWSFDHNNPPLFLITPVLAFALALP